MTNHTQATPTLVPKMYPMDVFGFTGTNVQVQGFEPCDHPNVPLECEYVFSRENVRDVIGFLDCSFGDGLMISGPTGCGKTSVIEQILARLHRPAQSYTCGASTEFMDLVGQWVMVAGDMVWMDGCLTTAMRHGHVLILNEIDLVDPAELANLNAVLEGAPLVITHNGGEIVKPHADFRFIATCNGNGNGGDGIYVGVQRQNLAFMDRFNVIKTNYLNPDIELDILKKVTPKIPNTIAKRMIELANKVRSIFIGEGDDDNIELSVTFSTRTLIRWAVLTQRNKAAGCPLSYALDRALLNRCAEKEEVEAIQALAIGLFGDSFNPAENEK